MLETYMKIAIAQAKKARGRVSPNPLVGAVVVKKGEVVGLGYHRRAGEANRWALTMGWVITREEICK